LDGNERGETVKVYLAHNFSARAWLASEIIPKLEAAEHKCVASWITDDSHLYSKNAEQSAVEDLNDIESADDLILFIDQFSDRIGKGKWVEFGFALRAGKRCILVGEDKSCIFENLPNIRHAKTIEEALVLL
jgi:nucleoside 2-deoxyribosyltransferase